MIKESYVIKKSIKYSMALKTMPIIKKFLENENKKLFKDLNLPIEKQLSHFNDAVKCIEHIMWSQKARYQDAFFIIFALTNSFLKIEQQVISKELDFSYLTEEAFWDSSNIDINGAIFFTYTFLNELYRDEIQKDFELLSKMESAEEFSLLRKRIMLEK